MVPAPAVTAILGDVLWCLGLGLLAGAARDALGLCLGNGRVRCFFWDLLAFVFAAVLLCGFSAGVSATGVARWYMILSMALGALGWYWALSGMIHRLIRYLVSALTWPFRMLGKYLLEPALQGCQNMVKSTVALHREKRKKREKKAKKRKKQLQKPGRILYN